MLVERSMVSESLAMKNHFFHSIHIPYDIWIMNRPQANFILPFSNSFTIWQNWYRSRTMFAIIIAQSCDG